MNNMSVLSGLGRSSCPFTSASQRQVQRQSQSVQCWRGQQRLEVRAAAGQGFGDPLKGKKKVCDLDTLIPINADTASVHWVQPSTILFYDAAGGHS